MANILLRPGWQIAERLVAPEAAFLNRRRFLRQMGFAGAAGLVAMPLAGCAKAEPPDADSRTSSAANAVAPSQAYPASRNHEFDPNRTFTNENVARRYNNFYQFTLSKDVYRYVNKFVTTHWPLAIGGR